jgi:hypothetical protein
MAYRIVTLDATSRATGFSVGAIPPMNVQVFLDSRGSGLAKTTYGGFWGIGKQTAAQIISNAAQKYSIKPEFILVTLQAEQGLVNDKTTYPADFSILKMSNMEEVKPAVPAGYDRVVSNNPKKSGGNRWVAVKGSWKMVAATGAGIPDVKAMPAWDVIPFLGFPNQVEQTAKLARKYLDRWASGDKLVTLYGGETIVAGDPETYAILMYTPEPGQLTARPKLYKQFFA